MLERSVRLLETFDPGVRDLSLSQMSSRSGFPLSSTSSLARELVRLGLLERTVGRKYRIGLHLWELASRTPGVAGLRETALPFLHRLQATLRQHSQLGILDGGDVLFLERLSDEESVVNYTFPGTRMPFYASSSGLVLGAFAEPELRERLISAPRPRYALEPGCTDNELRGLLAEIRKTGRHESPGWIHPQALALAVPVRGATGTVIAALAAVVSNDEGAVSGRARMDGITEILQRSSAQLYDALVRSQ